MHIQQSPIRHVAEEPEHLVGAGSIQSRGPTVFRHQIRPGLPQKREPGEILIHALERLHRQPADARRLQRLSRCFQFRPSRRRSNPFLAEHRFVVVQAQQLRFERHRVDLPAQRYRFQRRIVEILPDLRREFRGKRLQNPSILEPPDRSRGYEKHVRPMPRSKRSQQLAISKVVVARDEIDLDFHVWMLSRILLAQPFPELELLAGMKAQQMQDDPVRVGLRDFRMIQQNIKVPAFRRRLRRRPASGKQQRYGHDRQQPTPNHPTFHRPRPSGRKIADTLPASHPPFF
ncbi:hypothetical protein D3C74_331410 [compost metagenome]